MEKWIYEFMYRIPFIPISWIFGAAHGQKEYAQLFENGSIPVGRAIDLGCGEGSNAIYLSRKGFDVTGIDFSPTAIKRAIANAEAAGEKITFIEDDLTGCLTRLVRREQRDHLKRALAELPENHREVLHPGCCFVVGDHQAKDAAVDLPDGKPISTAPR